MASGFSITRHFLQFSPTQKNQNLVQKKDRKNIRVFPNQTGKYSDYYKSRNNN